jgi:hypothetical protein
LAPSFPLVFPIVSAITEFRKDCLYARTNQLDRTRTSRPRCSLPRCWPAVWQHDIASGNAANKNEASLAEERYQLFRYEGKRADGTPIVHPNYYVRHNSKDTCTGTDQLQEAKAYIKKMELMEPNTKRFADTHPCERAQIILRRYWRVEDRHDTVAAALIDLLQCAASTGLYAQKLAAAAARQALSNFSWDRTREKE